MTLRPVLARFGVVATLASVLISCGSIDTSGSLEGAVEEFGEISCSVDGEVFSIGFGPRSEAANAAEAQATCAHLSKPSAAEEATPVPQSTAQPREAQDEEAPTTVIGLLHRVGSGVLAIQTSVCGGSVGIGTGFLVSERHIATAAHVVADAEAIQVESNGVTRNARIVGADMAADLALLEVEVPLRGHVFDVAGTNTSVGERVLALGYPGGGLGELSVTSGLVSSMVPPGVWPTGLIQTDSAVNPGNSGGPLVNEQGGLVGMVQFKNSELEGVGFAASATDSAGLLQEWIRAPKVPPAPGCQTTQTLSTTSRYVGLTEVYSPHPESTAIAETLSHYMEGINLGDSRLAFDQLAPSLQAGFPLDRFTEDTSTSFNFGVTLWSVEHDGADRVTGIVTFTSLQEAQYGPNGETCTHWELQYTFLWSDSAWRIEKANNSTESPASCF